MAMTCSCRRPEQVEERRGMFFANFRLGIPTGYRQHVAADPTAALIMGGAGVR